MPDERPEEDLVEEARSSGSWSEEVDDPEAPDADAQEQHQPVDEPVGTSGPDLSDPEVPEADALEQSASVDGSSDEDYEPGPASEPPVE